MKNTILLNLQNNTYIKTQDALKRRRFFAILLVKATFEKIAKSIIQHGRIKKTDFEEFKKVSRIIYKDNSYIQKKDKTELCLYWKTLINFLQTYYPQYQRNFISLLDDTIDAIRFEKHIRWFIFASLSSLGILGSVWFSKKYPHLTEQIPLFRSIFGQNNIFNKL